MPTRRTLDRLGCRLSYRIEGDHGHPVVYIQGVGVHGDCWGPQVAAHAATHRCLTFDNRGMAASQPPGPQPLTIEMMADDTVALMDAAGFDAAHLVGHSMGGLIALAVALAHPTRVTSLSLLCSFAQGSEGASIGGRMFWLGLQTAIGTKRMRRHAFLEIVYPPEALAGADKDRMARDLEPLFGHDLAMQPPIAMKQLGAMRRCNLLSRLGELAALPTLVAVGAHDPIGLPERGRAIADAIPGSHFHQFEDAAHGLPIQHPDRINRLLASFWQTAQR